MSKKKKEAYSNEQLVKRMRDVFEDTPEVASWFKQKKGEEYIYEYGEVHVHLLGMWDTMLMAADRIEALDKENKSLREGLRHAISTILDTSKENQYLRERLGQTLGTMLDIRLDNRFEVA